MPSIGETLRDARMRQRLDIADVESRTKIRAKYLRALENEEFGMLPGPTFVKTFLRTYAEMLGLDPHLLVEEYRSNYESADELELQPLGPPGVSARDRYRYRGPRLGPGALALLVLVGVVAVLVAIGLASDDNGAQSEQAVNTETTRQRTTKKREQTPPPPTRVALKIVPATPVWVCVDHGAGTPVVFENTIDAPQRFSGKQVRVNLGKRNAQIWKNGKRVEVTPGGEAVGFAFTPKHTRELPSGERPCL